MMQFLWAGTFVLEGLWMRHFPPGLISMRQKEEERRGSREGKGKSKDSGCHIRLSTRWRSISQRKSANKLQSTDETILESMQIPASLRLTSGRASEDGFF